MKIVKKGVIHVGLWMSLTAGVAPVTGSAAAAQDLMLTGKEKLKATVSSSKINRITFGSGHFSRVIGDSSRYQLIIDELGANLFLTSKIPAGNSFELSIVNASGVVADLVLNVRDTEGQIINIYDESTYNARRDKEEQEVAGMLKAMIRSEQGKYYVKTVIRPLKTNLPLDSNLNVIQDRTYRYGDLTGARLIVKSTGADRKQVTELKEEDFRYMFERVKAVSIGNKHLSKTRPSYVWVITKSEVLK